MQNNNQRWTIKGTVNHGFDVTEITKARVQKDTDILPREYKN